MDNSSLIPIFTSSATTSDYQHNASNQLVGGNGIAPQYDANGDPTGDGQISQYVFDVRHRLVQIRQGVVITASFQYDALNRRIAKTDANGITTSYQYDGLDPVQENNGGTARSILTGQNIDERFGRDDTTGRTYFLTDHLGSTLALTDTSGNIVQRYNYEPYGAVQAAGAAGLSNPYQYTGRENDGNGLYYYRARYYNPATKRFISEDPLQEAAGPNSYAYVDGNPIIWIDPLGLIHYNAPSPRTVPVDGQTAANLNCEEICLRRRTNNQNLDLLVTGGAETTGHSSNSFHYTGQACDIAASNPVRSDDVFDCAAQCGFSGAQFETFRNNPNRNHFHLQNSPGNGVPPTRERRTVPHP